MPVTPVKVILGHMHIKTTLGYARVYSLPEGAGVMNARNELWIVMCLFSARPARGGDSLKVHACGKHAGPF